MDKETSEVLANVMRAHDGAKVTVVAELCPNIKVSFRTNFIGDIEDATLADAATFYALLGTIKHDVEVVMGNLEVIRDKVAQARTEENND